MEQCECLASIFSSYKGTQEELIPLLQHVQQDLGYLPDNAMLAIARFARRAGKRRSTRSPRSTRSSASRPIGKKHVMVCRGTSCHVRGAPRILEEIEKQLGIKEGETTPDLEYSLETVACIGACGLSPCVMINKKVEAKLTPKKVAEVLRRTATDDRQIFDDLRQRAKRRMAGAGERALGRGSSWARPPAAARPGPWRCWRPSGRSCATAGWIARSSKSAASACATPSRSSAIAKPRRPTICYGNVTPQRAARACRSVSGPRRSSGGLRVGHDRRGERRRAFPPLFDTPVFKPQVRRTLRNCGFIDPDEDRPLPRPGRLHRPRPGARAGPGADHRRNQACGPARPGRRRLSHLAQVAVLPRRPRRRKIPDLQRRRRATPAPS